MQKAKVALVGVSGFGNVHYKDIMRAYGAGLVEIPCATVINQDEEAEKCAVLRGCGCEVFNDAGAMFAKYAGKADVCFLPVGIGLHASMSIAAMRAGMNVMLEKPLAATVQEADAIIAAEKETGRFTAVGYQHMYQPQVAGAKRAILGGRIGRLRAVRCLGLWPRPESYYARNNWAGRLRTANGWILDSPVNNALAHYLNLTCFFGGTTQDDVAGVVSLEAGLYRANPGIESFDTAFLKMKTADNTDLFFAASHVSQDTVEPVVEAIGDAGRILLGNGACSLLPAGGAPETIPLPGPDEIRDNIMRAVLNRLRDGHAPVFTPQRARPVTAIVDTAHATTPIIQVPSAHVSKVPDNGGHRYIWNGLDAIIRRTHDEIRMPAVADFGFCHNGPAANPAAMTFFDHCAG